MKYRLNGYRLGKVDESTFAMITKDNPENYVELSPDLYALMHRLTEGAEPGGPMRAGCGSEPSSGYLDQLADLLRQAGILADAGRTAGNAAPCAGTAARGDGPLMSIVLLDYNHAEVTSRCIDSITRSDYQRFEIIVVENGSRRDNVEKVRSRYSANPRVTLVWSFRNLGFSGGNNLGIRRARGDVLFILNNDTTLAPDALGILADFHATHADQISVPKLYLAAFPQFLNAMGNSVSVDDWGCDNGIGHLDAGQFDGIKTVKSANFAAIGIPRRVYEEVGGLDQSVYFMYYEDADWCFRAFIKGYKIHVMHEAKVYHDFCATTRTWKKKWAWVVQGRISFAIRFFDRPLMVHALKNYLRLDYSAFIGNGRLKDYATCYYYLKGYFRTFLLLPRLLISRRRLVNEKKRRGRDEADFLRKSFPPPLMKAHGPCMTKEVVDDLLRKRRRMEGA